MEDRLHKFAYLVDAGSFTKAAEELHISQPALSTAIRKLERELHSPLLMRGTRPLKLTRSGEAAYAHAKETTVRTGNLKLHIAQAAREKIAVKVGMIDSLADALFGRGSGLTELEQHASVSFIINNSRYLADAVACADIDIAFVVEQSHFGSSISPERIGAEPLVLVCHRALLADTNRALAQNKLPNFISYDQSSTTFRIVQRKLASKQISIKPTFYSTSPEVIRKLVLAQKGVAALPYLLVQDLINQRILTPVAISNSAIIIERSIQAVKHRDKHLPNPLLNIKNQLHEILQNLTAEAAKL